MSNVTESSPTPPATPRLARATLLHNNKDVTIRQHAPVTAAVNASTSTDIAETSLLAAPLTRIPVSTPPQQQSASETDGPFKLPLRPASDSPDSPHHRGRKREKERRRSRGVGGLGSIRQSSPIPDERQGEDVQMSGMEAGMLDDPADGPASPSYEPTPSPEEQRTPAPRSRLASNSYRRSSAPSLNRAERPRSRSRSIAPDVRNHGLTTYIPVPPNETMWVENKNSGYLIDRSRPELWRRYSTGSIRGHYLDAERAPFKKLQEDIREAELSKPPHLRLGLRAFDGERWEGSLRCWDRKWAQQITDKAKSFSWMRTEVWGGPIANPADAPRRRPTGHPSSTLCLSPIYGGGSPERKRSAPGSDSGGSPPKQLKKSHPRFTSPQPESLPSIAESPQPEPESLPSIAEMLGGFRTLASYQTARPGCTFCSNCKAREGPGVSLFLCLTCGNNAYCSVDCEQKYKAWHMLTCRPPESSEVTDCSPLRNEMSIHGGSRNLVADTQPKETDRTHYSQTPKTATQPQANNTDWHNSDITGFRTNNGHRVLEYRLRTQQRHEIYTPADQLVGPLWTSKISRF